MHDGNVAFKVTWVYGESGPFTTPCTAEGRKINIKLAGKVWCSQRENICYKAWAQGNDAPPVDCSKSWPCFDSAIFEEWSFSAGVWHNGRRAGKAIPIVYAKPGKLAFFTSREFDKPESERLVIGCFRISEIAEGKYGQLWVHSHSDDRIRVKNFQKAPKFWKYHKQNGGSRWGTGLFRYLPDEEAERLLRAVRLAA